jgi:hypothetical protein
MPETVTQNCGVSEKKVVNVITDRARLIFEVFLAGTGLMLWVSVMFFSPLNDVKGDIKLIQKDINTIQINHEAHIENVYKELSDLKIKENETDIRLEKQNETIIKLLTIYEESK